jgi:hypothetical protein
MTIEVDQAIAELQELVKCRCDPAYEDRGLHDPNCQCDYASEVKVIVDYIEQLNAKLAKALEALEIARVHVANNAQGWSVSRAPSRDDLTIVDSAIAELKGQNDD